VISHTTAALIDIAAARQYDGLVVRQPETPSKRLSMTWSRLPGVGVDVLVVERGDRSFPELVLDRPMMGCVELGASRAVTRDGEKEVHAGTVRFAVPGECTVSRPLTPFARSTLVLLPTEAPASDLGFDAEPGGVFNDQPATVDAPDLVASLMALKEVALDSPGDALAADEAWSGLVRNIGRAAGSSSPEPRRRTGERGFVRAVSDYLRQHSSESVRLHDLVSFTGFTRSYLISAFHDATGMTPHRYLVALRLARASDLMMNGASATEAALASGFADQSHFSRWFHRVLETSPSSLFGSAGHRPPARAR
jgi:AraC-like DNA-binding protein